MLSKTLFHFLIPEAEGTPSSRLHENLCCITYLISQQANSWTFETGHGLELTNPRWRFFVSPLWPGIRPCLIMSSWFTESNRHVSRKNKMWILTANWEQQKKLLCFWTWRKSKEKVNQLLATESFNDKIKMNFFQFESRIDKEVY